MGHKYYMSHTKHKKHAIQMLDSLDYMTALHCLGVARIAVSIGKELSLSHDRLELIELGALLHDQGKRAILADIILKDGKLTPGEYMLVKSHPVISKELTVANPIGFPPLVGEIVLQHHERVDGTGYPYNLPRDKILLEAQIVAVADTIDAMLHRRPYRANVNPMDIIKPELLSLVGTAFLPEVVEAAIKVM
jgi:HD-GYP domain-containing protein (c-di-GMP phosphodiesterase class II)